VFYLNKREILAVFWLEKSEFDIARSYGKYDKIYRFLQSPATIAEYGFNRNENITDN